MGTTDAQAATLRRAARVFSSRAFRPIMKGQDNGDLGKHISALRKELQIESQATNGEVVQSAYKLLAKSYRSEYVYKNLIATKLFVGRHRASNSVLLNEFRVGTAIADCVFINGQATVYEIKTELDNPEKLERQLAEYYTAFTDIYVVVHESMATKYAEILDRSTAGIISVGPRWRLSTAKEAEPYTGSLEVRAMFNALRKSETEFALQRLGFPVPTVPNGLRYGRHLSIAMQASAEDFNRVFQEALKRRRLAGDVSLHRDPTLLPLRSLLVQLDPSPAEGANLRAWLSQRS